MRPELEPILRDLLARGSMTLGLDDIGEAIGLVAVDADDVRQLFAALESAGRKIQDPVSAPASETLRKVLITARALRLERGEVPSATEIADRSGIPVEAVRRALFFALVAQR